MKARQKAKLTSGLWLKGACQAAGNVKVRHTSMAVGMSDLVLEDPVHILSAAVAFRDNCHELVLPKPSIHEGVHKSGCQILAGRVYSWARWCSPLCQMGLVHLRDHEQGFVYQQMEWLLCINSRLGPQGSASKTYISVSLAGVSVSDCPTGLRIQVWVLACVFVQQVSNSVCLSGTSVSHQHESLPTECYRPGY